MPGPRNHSKRHTKCKPRTSIPRAMTPCDSTVSSLENEEPGDAFFVQTAQPFIHDPGNGPRIRDINRFLSSPFAKTVSLDDPICSTFAQTEVAEMLCTILPPEMALILWYNKSRSMSRICPTCHRLFTLGDLLPDHAEEETLDDISPILFREQTISGICSPVCFVLACYAHPNAIKSAWGRSIDEIDDHTWEVLNSAGEADEVEQGLGFLVRMTRLDDLGLDQMIRV